MTARDTSREAFRDIQPKLNEKQRRVLVELEASHALTNSEIARALLWSVNTVTPRTNELVKYGLVQSFGKRKCRVTGRTAYAWGVVKGERPVAAPKMVPMSVTVDGVRMIRLVPEEV